MKREKSLERIVLLDELDIASRDSLISTLENQIIFAADEIDRMQLDCKKQKRGQLFIGFLAGAGVVGILAAVFGP